MLNDTILAQATPTGTGALGIVRLSGPDAVTIACRVFRPAARLRGLPSHACIAGRVVDGGCDVDQVVATVFRAPRSYTGEDCVEITCHGGPVVVGRLLQLLRAAGARPARPGEFTQRAFTHGKIDLAQAEAVAALIAARSAAGAQAALRVLRGTLSQALEASMAVLTQVRAQVEVGLDFQEDGAADVVVTAVRPGDGAGGEALERLLVAEEERLARLQEGSRAGRLLEEGTRVALIGRPNAGKSSLFNALLGRERAIVAAESGTTRDTLEAWVEWDGLAVALVDTAGLGPARAEVDRESMRRARAAAEAASLVILVVDTAAERASELERLVQDAGIAPETLIVALHKWDLGPQSAWLEIAEQGALEISGARIGSAEASHRGGAEAQRIPVVQTSAVGEPGSGALRQLVAARLATDAGETTAALAMGEWQRDRLASAHDAVARARNLMREGEGGELVAFELREALEALGEILGRRAGPMLLEAVFSRFCVGK
jgi:tRNA modification GTPase